MALAITGGGGLAMFAGFLLLGQIAGSYELSVILRSADIIHDHPWYLPMLLLVLIGVFTKSAQFPFHFWLPHAMAAPTPVSAYLHSATMVKAGVFLLARLFPALSDSAEWTWIVGATGLATLLFGSIAALFQHDLKGLLAYSTISHLGLITLLFGIGTPLAANRPQQEPRSTWELRTFASFSPKRGATKKGGHPARPDCLASPASGGYDIGQTEARNTFLLLTNSSPLSPAAVLGKIPSVSTRR